MDITQTNIRTTTVRVLHSDRQRLGSNYNTGFSVSVIEPLHDGYPHIDLEIGINTALDTDHDNIVTFWGLTKNDCLTMSKMLERASEFLANGE